LRQSANIFPSLNSHFYIAGGHCPCGCAFPEELPDGKSRSKDNPEDMARLSAALEPVVSSRPRVQLYLCFEGDEEEAPERHRSVRLNGLAQPDFRLHHLEIVTVFRGA
jgi:hypothetical protein